MPVSQITSGSTRKTELSAQIAEARARIASGRKEPTGIQDVSRLERTRDQARRISDGLVDAVKATADALTASRNVRSGLGDIMAILDAAKAPGADLVSLQGQLEDANRRLAVLAGSSALLGSTEEFTWKASSGGYSITLDASGTRILSSDGSGVLSTPLDLSVLEGGAPSTVGLSGSGTAFFGRASTTPLLGGLTGPADVVEGLDRAPPSLGGIVGSASSVGGRTAVAPSTAGLSGAGSTTTGLVRDPTAAVASIGTFSTSGLGSGDTITLKIAVNGGAQRDVLVRVSDVTDRASLIQALGSSVDQTFGQGTLTVGLDSGGDITLTTAAEGSTASVSVSSVTVSDGDGRLTSTLGLSAQSTPSDASTYFNGRSYVYDSLGQFDTTGIDRTDRLAFQVEVYVAASNRTISRTVEVSLANVGTGQNLADALNAKIQQDANLAPYVGTMYAYGEIAFAVTSTFNANDRINVSAITPRDGNGVSGESLGLNTGSDRGGDAPAPTAASVLTGSDFTSTTVQAGSNLSFDVVVDGSARRVTVDRGTVDAALGADASLDRTITGSSDMARVLTEALAQAGVGDVTVVAEGARFRFTSTATPRTGSTIGLASVASTRGSDTLGSATAGSAFSAITLASNASIDVSISVDGTPSSFSVTREDVDAVLGASAGGRIGNVGDLAQVVAASFTRYGIGGVTVRAASDRLIFETTSVGNGSSVVVQSVVSISEATRATTTLASGFVPTVVRDDAAISFDITTDGRTTMRVSIDAATVEDALGSVAGRTPGSGTIDDASQMASVVDLALRNAGRTDIAVSERGGRVVLSMVDAGSAAIRVTNPVATASTALAPTWTAGTPFTDTIVVDDRDTITFDLEVDGEAPVRVVVDGNTVQDALGSAPERTPGRIDDAGELAAVLTKAMQDAGVVDVVASDENGSIRLSRSTPGLGSVAITGVVSSTGLVRNDLTLDRIDLTGDWFAGLDADRRSAIVEVLVANATQIASDVDRVSKKLAFTQGLLSIQQGFTELVATVSAGSVGRLVDVDMDEENARLSALEARQALLIRSRSILSSGLQDLYGS